MLFDYHVSVVKKTVRADRSIKHIRLFAPISPPVVSVVPGRGQRQPLCGLSAISLRLRQCRLGKRRLKDSPWFLAIKKRFLDAPPSPAADYPSKEPNQNY